MRMIHRHCRPLLIFLALAGCAAPPERPPSAGIDPEAREPAVVYGRSAGSVLGEPLAVSVDFGGTVYVADGAPGRLLAWMTPGAGSIEFQRPAQQPGFYPSDVKASGFFVYAVDPNWRTLLRFDNRGAYRDILIKFDEVAAGRRIIPTGLDVDSYGRTAVSDVANHQILVFDAYLAVELVFGNYGSSPGQFIAPEGVSFMPAGGFLVTDTGNRRIQMFDSGGKFVRSLPLPGDGINPLVKPRRAVADKSGAVFVADPAARRVFVFSPDGTLSYSIVPADAAEYAPTDVDVDASNAVYVTDAGSASVFVFK